MSDETDNTDLEPSDTEPAASSSMVPVSSAVDPKVGMWVVVRYDGQLYPGEVASVIDANEAEVSCMRRSSKSVIGHQYWKWPKPQDKAIYENSAIKMEVNPPAPVGTRGNFYFAEYTILH